MKLFLALVSIAIMFAPVHATGASLSDEAAAEVIEEDFNSATMGIRTGEIMVSNSPLGDRPGVISEKSYESYIVPLIQAGKITASVVREPTPAEQGLGGIGHILFIELTENGKRESVTRSDGLIGFSIGEFDVYEVIGNEEVVSSLEIYRVVRVRYRANWQTYAMPLQTVCGRDIPSAERKGIALLKYDAFDERWGIVTGDYTDADTDFCTKRVQTAISKLR